MTFKSRLRTLFFGKWTSNRLMSRKWWLALSVIYVAIVADLTGHPLSADTLNFVQGVAVPWLAVQGVVDIVQIRQSTKSNPGGEV